AANPRMLLPVSTVMAKPAMAATSIMPSEPRLITPDFSLISNPSDASMRGVPATMAEAIKGARDSISGPPPDFVVDEHITGQQGKQQYPLKNARYSTGHAQTALGQFTTYIEQRHDETAENNANGVQPPHKRHNNG